MSAARFFRNDLCPCGSGKDMAYCCLRRMPGGSAAYTGYITEGPTPRARSKATRFVLFPECRVKAFLPIDRRWTHTALQEVKPGQEFIAFDRLFKVLQPEVYAEKVQVDVSKNPDADRPFDRANFRSPGAYDVVYVFDEEAPNFGHCLLGSVDPGQRCVFQGRVYAVEPGPTPSTAILVGLNQIFSDLAPKLAERNKVMIEDVVVGQTRVTCAPMPPSTGLEGTVNPPTPAAFCGKYQAIQKGDRTHPTEVVVHYTHPEIFGYAEVEIVVGADEYFRLFDGASVSVLHLKPGLEILLTDGTVGKITFHKFLYDIPEPPKPVERGLWLSRVIGRIKHTAYEILEWHLAGQTIRGTPDHLVWSVSRKGWVRACELIPGELVRPAGDFVLPVESVGPRRTGFIEVYGIEVEFFHNYFVGPGDSCMLVHNGPEYIRRPAQGPAQEPRMIEGYGWTGPKYWKMVKRLQAGESVEAPNIRMAAQLRRDAFPELVRSRYRGALSEAPDLRGTYDWHNPQRMIHPGPHQTPHIQMKLQDGTVL